jgi:hypothetical protein
LNSKNILYVQFLKEFHSGWAYIALRITVAVVNAMGMFQKEFTARIEKLRLG